MKNKPSVKQNIIPKVIKTMGPVVNLEKHLHPDWWKRIFNSIYLRTDADVVEDKNITENEISMFIQLLNIQNGDSILDLACGQGRHLIELTNRGNFKLFGIDRSRSLIQRAKNLARQKNLSINFKEGDARKLPYATDSMDFVTILGNSFGYFETSEDDLKILKEVFRILKPEGKILMDVADGAFLRENYTPRSWEWMDKKYFVCRERSLSSDNERLISRELVSHTEKGVIVDQFYAERLYTKDILARLFSEAGFKETVFHDNMEVDSQRNQDLGMMANRIIVTSKVVKEWTPKKSKKAIKNVVVLMGDPNLNDIVKPNSKFDTDDFETIEKLKIALSKLDNYKFSYIFNHASLLNDLQKLKDKTDLVLNLCDEGYNNDAKKELHIPALLEMIGLPYTGSNPQTLAYCYDKSLIRGIATEIGVPVADAFVITAEENLYELNIPFPVIAKPNFGDSSFGITQKNVANTVEELANAILRIREQFDYSNPILVEEFLTGAEVSVGIIGNSDNNMVLPIIEEDYSQLPEGLPKICGYEAKWISDSPYMLNLKSIRASLPSHVEQELVHHSLKLFQRLECKDYCRFDWRLNSSGEPKLLEVNPNPGWCWDGHLARMCSHGNMDYSQMLEAILNAAEVRHNQTEAVNSL